MGALPALVTLHQASMLCKLPSTHPCVCVVVPSAVRVTGLTLSKEQLAEATARVAAAGLTDKVTLLFCDYRCGLGTMGHCMHRHSIHQVLLMTPKYCPFGAVHTPTDKRGVCRQQLGVAASCIQWAPLKACDCSNMS